MELKRGNIRLQNDKFLDPEETKFQIHLSSKSAIKQYSNQRLKKVCHF